MARDNASTITILGTGYVGLTSAAMFAAAGLKTYVVDINPARLESVRQGKSFFFEDGLDALIADGVQSGRLIPTDAYAEAVPASDVIFSCVGTPDNPDGSSNLRYVFAAAEEAAKYMKAGAVFVQKSTVPVGTGQDVKAALSKASEKYAYVSNPEFLREASALHDSLWFDRIVLGGDDTAALKTVSEIYKQVHARREHIARLAGLTAPLQPPKGEYIMASLPSAELIKVSSNAFLALKISFANSIAKLADAAEADVTEVMQAVGADPRIGHSFLNAGRGYGGGCFPKDVTGLISSGITHGVDLEIMQAVAAVNETMPGYIAEKLQDTLGTFQAKKVAVLGLAFKAGTSDTRRSPGITLANLIAKRGASVAVYDPEANDEAGSELRRGIRVGADIADTLDGAEAVLVTTDWPVFLDYHLDDYARRLVNGKIFVDCMNRFRSQEVKQAGLTYIGVGRR